MTLADNSAHRARFIARIAAVQLELTDLHHELDIAFATRPSHETVKALAEADVHIEFASADLATAARAIASLP